MLEVNRSGLWSRKRRVALLYIFTEMQFESGKGVEWIGKSEEIIDNGQNLNKILGQNSLPLLHVHLRFFS